MTKPPVRPGSKAAPPRRPLTLRDVSEAVRRQRDDRQPRAAQPGRRVPRHPREGARRGPRLGYVPNKIAGALASQRVNLVAVIVPSLSNMVFPEVLTGISRGLEDTGLQPVLGVTNYSAEREEAVLYEMLSWRPSGVIWPGWNTATARGR
jgi:LacI family transcriptional regulator, gluconate utilization system Gnt-I transcriptional repressor